MSSPSHEVLEDRSSLSISVVLMEANPSSLYSLLVLGTKLGSGTSGVVYQAQYGDQPCAAKALVVSQSELDRKTIDREISVLQRLRFRHVIQLYRTHEQNDRIYILMELAEKGSLAQAINKGHLANNDWVTKRRLAHEIARGLAYIHQEGVLHRVLKSANVLLTKHMEVKLAGFGLAQIRSMASAASSADGKDSTKAAGALRWVAPELLYAGEPRYSTKSDVYSLGVVMWEMAADCTKPFKDQSNEALVALSVKNGRREQLPGETPSEYRTWVERCWAQDPGDRPSADEILVHDESIEESGDTDESFLDLGSSGIGLAHVPEASNRSDEVFEQDAMGLDRTYESGQDFVSSNASTTVTWYRRATDGGSAEAQLVLGNMYTSGYGVKEDTSEAAIWYKMAAKQGNHEAQIILGQWYALGRGVIQSDEHAVKWFTLAAEQGNPVAQTKLGQMYLDRYFQRFVGNEVAWCTKLIWEGQGVDQNDVEAVKWFTKAAEQGDENAQHNLGVMYEYGQGVDQNNAEAAKWYTMAAEQGDVNAQINLGWMYALGQGVDQSDGDAVKWYTKAAEKGDSGAQNYLGLKYAQGQGVDQSLVEAFMWFTKAAEQGNPSAQCNVGLMYAHGQGVDQSDADAVKWYTKASEQGDAYAQRNLGLMYAQGRGVDQNSAEAAKWFTKAAEQGNINAQNNLGRCYDLGRGVEQCDVEAVKWYIKAAEQGNVNAQHNLGLMYAQGRGVNGNGAEAVKWFTKAVEQGDADAQHNLGWRYGFGRGVGQCDVNAAKWHSRSVAQHNELAQFDITAMYGRGLAVYPRDEGHLHLHREAMTQSTTNVLLVGNSGVGKSYLLNSIGGNFDSGFNIMDSMTTTCSYCDATLGTAAVRLVDTPGLLEATSENVARNAKAITDALNMEGGFKMIIVLPESGGRLMPSDVFMIGKVLEAIDFSIDVGLIINKVPEDDLEFYGDVFVRNDLLTKLNNLAEGKIKSSWFVAIPRFRRDNPKGPQRLMTDLLSNMTSQDIPKVNPIKISVKEFDRLLEFSLDTGDFATGIWKKFLASFKK
ncbi:hypothetical protein DFQ26_004041 [Actinomortierella ambigua]|nr:hypothetical protein DFQ26_004041 [Actinomortierella ambigua]